MGEETAIMWKVGMKKIIILLFVLALPASVMAGNFAVIKKEIFGLNLGATAATVERAAVAAGIKIDKESWSFQDKDMPGTIWSLPGALNKNEAVKSTRLYLFNGQVYTIILHFKDSSRENFNVLKKTLNEKYGGKKEGFLDALESKASFETSFNGVPVLISVDLDINFSSDDDLSVKYGYEKMMNSVIKEYENRKAQKVKGDL